MLSKETFQKNVSATSLLSAKSTILAEQPRLVAQRSASCNKIKEVLLVISFAASHSQPSLFIHRQNTVTSLVPRIHRPAAFCAKQTRPITEPGAKSSCTAGRLAADTTNHRPAPPPPLCLGAVWCLAAVGKAANHCIGAASHWSTIAHRLTSFAGGASPFPTRCSRPTPRIAEGGSCFRARKSTPSCGFVVAGQHLSLPSTGRSAGSERAQPPFAAFKPNSFPALFSSLPTCRPVVAALTRCARRPWASLSLARSLVW